MSEFVYCECPECEFSVVVPAGALAGGLRIACTMCFEDSGHEVAMLSRPALDTDKPEGMDARDVETTTFVCAGCGKSCLSSQSNEIAAEEYFRIHGVRIDSRCEQVCDDCFIAGLAPKGSA